MKRVVVLSTTLVLATGFCIGCRSIPPLPPADLSTPGWRVQTGQAVWKPTRTKSELVGELLMATNANGKFVVQFSKTPFTFATAQVAGDRWQIEFGAGEYRTSGIGRPPVRFVWFQLPRALAGVKLARVWRFEHLTTNSWRFENSSTGETLEGEFFP